MSTRPGAQQVLLFRAAGVPLGVFMAEVNRLVVNHGLLAVPFAHPALLGLLPSEDGPLPVFDLRGLIEGHATDPVALDPTAPGGTVAIFTTERGPIGLQMDEMRGNTGSYRWLADATEQGRLLDELPVVARHTAAGVGLLEDDEPFFFFSPEAFVIALDLSRPARPPG